MHLSLRSFCNCIVHTCLTYLPPHFVSEGRSTCIHSATQRLVLTSSQSQGLFLVHSRCESTTIVQQRSDSLRSSPLMLLLSVLERSESMRGHLEWAKRTYLRYVIERSEIVFTRSTISFTTNVRDIRTRSTHVIRGWGYGESSIRHIRCPSSLIARARGMSAAAAWARKRIQVGQSTGTAERDPSPLGLFTILPSHPKSFLHDPMGSLETSWMWGQWCGTWSHTWSTNEEGSRIRSRDFMWQPNWGLLVTVYS